MDLTIKIHDCSVDGESGFAAICAEFPEANGQGETRDECLSNLRQAINEVISYRRAHSLTPPPPRLPCPIPMTRKEIKP
jgi:predicted RNase H-like HicB family nuclease